MTEDTLHLLKECDAGCKTAVNSIKEVLDNTKSEKLLETLTLSLERHQRLGDEIHEKLSEEGKDGKEPNVIARAMSWIKINAKIMAEPSDSTVANLMTDGCHMGIKQLGVYKNQYPDADEDAMRLTDKLIKEEERLAQELKEFL